MSSNDLHETKQRLLEKLGPSYGSYVQLLGKWFRGIISKEEFDKSAKQLVEENFVIEHNKFWLAFFQHCANNASKSIQSHNHFRLNEKLNRHHNHPNKDNDYRVDHSAGSPGSMTDGQSPAGIGFDGNKVRCLPNKVITHMRILVIAWEMGLDSVNDHVSSYINLALHHFLKNIITELICTKTAYRLRENRFRYAFGVKPMNPYLNNSLKVYTSNLEYDPYQIESNKMNSSLVDTYAYNDSLFPSRLYEAQALYEYACSTTSPSPSYASKPKRPKLSDIFFSNYDENEIDCNIKSTGSDTEQTTNDTNQRQNVVGDYGRRLTIQHLLMAFLSDRTVIPSQSLYSINLERIFSRYE